MKNLSASQYQKISNNMQLGIHAIQSSQLDIAEKYFLSCLKIKPDLVDARAYLAYVLTASKQHVKATKELRLLLKSNINVAQTHFNLANSLYEQKIYDEAIFHYEKSLTINPDNTDCLINYSIVLHKSTQTDKAITQLHLALNLDKRNARAFYILGSIYADIEDFPKALECLENAKGLLPQQIQYKIGFAEVLAKAGLDFEAGLELHSACESNPKHIDSFISYGDFLLEHHRHDEALECFTYASTLKPDGAYILERLGNTYLEMGNIDAAIEKLNSALDLEPNRINSLQSLGKLYLETGDTKAVVDIANKISNIDASQPGGFILLSKARKSRSDDDIADNLCKFLSKNNLSESYQIDINYALGKVYDDHKNYREAFKHYSAANILKNKTLNYTPEKDANYVSDLINFFNADFFKTHSNLSTEKSLPIIIVGMPRSGTTLTEQIISSHPKVMGAGEVVFWSKSPTALPLRIGSKSKYPACISDMSSAEANNIASMYENVLRQIAGPSNNALHITDKLPHNFLYVGLITLLFPNVKIIHTKRNPIDTCLSIFFQNFNKSHTYSSDLNNLASHYNQYIRIMKHWHSVLPGRIFDINYEDTIADPEYWSRQLIEHIGLEWDDSCLAPHKLERTVKTASHWQVRQPIYKTSVERWRNYEEFIGPLIEALKD